LDVNAPNDRGETPLYVSASLGYYTLVKTLCEYPGIVVDLEAKSMWGDTALDAAREHRFTPVVEYLEEAIKKRKRAGVVPFALTVAATLGLIAIQSLLRAK